MRFTSKHAIVGFTSLFKCLKSIVLTLKFYCTNSKKNARTKLRILIYFLINTSQMSKLKRHPLLRQIWKKNAIAIRASKNLIDGFFTILIVTG